MSGGMDKRQKRQSGKTDGFEEEGEGRSPRFGRSFGPGEEERRRR